MNRLFLMLSAITIIFVQIACKPDVPKANIANNIQPTNKVENVVENLTANANANVKQSVAPIEFTDANEALTEGKKLLDAGKDSLAVAALKQAVKINPELAEAHFQLGVAQALLESEDETKVIGDTKIKGSKKANATVELTNSEKSFAEAVKAYQKLLAKNPKDDVAQFNLGRAYNKLNKDKEAESALRKAANMKPDNAEYQLEVGAILIKFTKYQEALGVLKKIKKADPSNSQADSLIEKAEAGAKRENFGVKPKDKPVSK
jgi:tetratricopeptide (TPR) repeat protein